MEYGILIGAQMHLLMLAYEATQSKSTFIRYKVCQFSSSSFKLRSHKLFG